MSLSRDAIILACGSYSPVTYMHLHLLECARDAVRDRGYAAVTGILSPVHGAYGKDGLAPANDRIEMALIAVASSDWVVVSDWEAKREEYSRSVDVARHVRLTYGRDDTAVVFVCGSDLVKAMAEKSVWTAESIHDLLREVVLAVSPRPGADIQELVEDPVFEGFRDRIWTIEGVFSDLSSSLIRSYVTRGRSIKYLTPDGVISYIAKRNLFA